MSATTGCIRSNRPRPRYDSYLREQGFDAPNPWEHWANSGADANGELQNGWLLVHADKAARIPRRAFRDALHDAARDGFYRGSGRRRRGRGACICPTSSRTGPISRPNPTPACTAPADVQPAIRSEKERQEAHPVFAAYMDMRYSRNMARDEAREKVIPTYMGLIKQIDDQMGVLMQFLEERGLLETTMIVFTSDHGDYLGDHWMGEKDLFHDQSAKIPLIVIDPSPRGRCHARQRQRRAGGGDRSGADLHRLFRRHAAQATSSKGVR